MYVAKRVSLTKWRCFSNSQLRIRLPGSALSATADESVKLKLCFHPCAGGGKKNAAARMHFLVILPNYRMYVFSYRVRGTRSGRSGGRTDAVYIIEECFQERSSRETEPAGDVAAVVGKATRMPFGLHMRLPPPAVATLTTLNVSVWAESRRVRCL